MIAANWQTGHHGDRFRRRRQLTRFELISNDTIIRLGEQSVFVDADTSAAPGALAGRATKALRLVSVTIPLGILQRNQEAFRWRRVVLVVGTAPAVDVDRAVGGDSEVAHVAKLIGKYCGAEARPQREAGILAAGCGLGRGRRRRLRRNRRQ